MSDDVVIELEDAHRPRRPGDVLRGRVWVRPGAGGTSRALRVRRCWKTHGRGNRDTGSALELTLHEGPIPADGPEVFPFEFDVPPGPSTYRGRLLNVDYYVEAWLDLPMAIDAKTEVEFEVVAAEDPAPPPAGLRERSEKAGKAGVSGCGLLVGIAMVFVGFALLPMGLLLIAGAAFLVVPPVRKAIAEKKLGRISARLRPEIIAPGGDVEVEVEIHPDRDRSVNQVAATLRCREICVSGRGTDRTTHREEIASFPVTLQGPSALRKDARAVFDRTVPVPEDAAHTFASSNNNVVWDVELHVDIPSWPDWRERLPLVVWPRPVREGPGAGGPPAAAGEIAPRPLDPRPAAGPRGTEAAERVGLAVGPEDRPASADVPEPAATKPATSVETPADPPPGPSPASPPAASTPQEPAPLPPDAPELARRLRAILAEPRFGGRRDELIEELIGGEYDFILVVERNERSFGVPADYRDGRTLRGTLDGTEFVVEVRFPPGRNDDLAELGRGDRVPVQARVIQWERLRSQPLMEV